MATQCAWCHPAGSPGHDPKASHGICERHQSTLLVEIPLQRAVARLSSAEFLGREAREEIARSITAVVARIKLMEEGT